MTSFTFDNLGYRKGPTPLERSWRLSFTAFAGIACAAMSLGTSTPAKACQPRSRDTGRRDGGPNALAGPSHAREAALAPG